MLVETDLNPGVLSWDSLERKAAIYKAAHSDIIQKFPVTTHKMKVTEKNK